MKWTVEKNSIPWHHYNYNDYKCVIALDAAKRTCIFIMYKLDQIFKKLIQGHKLDEAKEIVKKEIERHQNSSQEIETTETVIESRQEGDVEQHDQSVQESIEWAFDF